MNRIRTTTRGRALGATALAAALLAGGLLLPARAQSQPSVSISTLDGQDVSGGSAAAPVNGAVLSATGTARIEPGVLADAGQSVARPVGESLPVTGIASFGTAPYRFRWSYDGSSTRFADPASQSTTFDSEGLEAGPVTLSLLVTDATGDTDSDTVKVFLQAPTRDTVLDHTGPIGPGLPDEFIGRDNTDGSDESLPFTVPAGAESLALELSWENSANDLDLRVDDPSGAEDENTTGAGSSNPEKITIADPAPGGWSAKVSAFLNTPENFTLTAVATGVADDPAPALDAGGPYRFPLEAVQRLTASTTGGSAPVSLAWDLDGDNRFESAGASVTTDFGIGTHLVTVKATDAAGYEKRETLGVQVADVSEPSTPGLVVVAIADSGVNAYHDDFRATTYRDPGVLDLTGGFTRHPSEYLPGYPADTPTIDLTLGDEYYPAVDKVVDAGDGRTTLPEVQEDKLYWIPGTKIIGAYDSGNAAFVNSTAPDAVPLLDEDGHGTGSASVAVGNLYGFCPTCLLVVTEATDTTWEYDAPWIDIASNSFGTLGNVGGAGTYAPDFPKASAERGQLSLYAAGNGNENAFVTPQQTYISDTLGPDWVVRVGAVTTGSRNPILGTGKPVDIASFGSGDIPAADPTSVHGLGSHSGTSAATPYSAGVFGTVLATMRSQLRDEGVGQRPAVGPGVIADGFPLSTSPYLHDGILTRTELVEAVFKTAEHDTSGASAEYPVTTPPEAGYQYAFEGYGIVEPASGTRAIEVLLGFAPLPERPEEDAFFAEDERIRDEIWGDWAGGGADSSGDAAAPEWRPRVDPLAGQAFAAVVTRPREGTVIDPASRATLPVAGQSIFPAYGEVAATPTRFFPHRKGATAACAQPYTETMDRADTAPDCEVGYTFQATGIQPSEEYHSSEDTTFGSGSATGIIYVQSTTPSPHELTISLKGAVGGRTVEIGQDVVSGTAQPSAAVPFAFDIAVPAEAVGVTYDGVTLSVHISQTASTNGKSSLDDPASFVDLPLADEGAVPERLVELSVDDASFAAPVPAELAADSRSFSAVLSADLPDGEHRIYSRARQGEAVSPAAVRTIRAQRSAPSVATPAAVQAQITRSGAAPAADRWTAVTSTATPGQDPFTGWSVDLPMQGLPAGNYVLHTRLVRGADVLATDTATFSRGAATGGTGGKTPPAGGGSGGGTGGGGTGGGGTSSTGERAPGTGTGGGGAGDTGGTCARGSRTTGYRMVDEGGTVYGFGAAGHLGDAPVGDARVVDIEAASAGDGYWVLDRLGHVFSFGAAPYLGGLGALEPGEEATSLSAVPCRDGYWIFTNRGRAVAFGAARFLGDMSAIGLNGPVLDSVATPTGAGYYMVAADGGIFTFGDARFVGSMGDTPLNAPVQSLVPDSDDGGYWLVASDGGVFTFDAVFRGSMGDTRLNGPVTGMIRYAGGYLMVGEDGGIFNFSDEPFQGSLGDRPPARPVVSVSARYGD